MDPPGPVSNKYHLSKFPDGFAEMWAAVIITPPPKISHNIGPGGGGWEKCLANVEAEFNYEGEQSINQSCLHSGAPVKTLNTEAQMSFSGWHYSMLTVTHQQRTVNATSSKRYKVRS